jgi:hypothetical protein
VAVGVVLAAIAGHIVLLGVLALLTAGLPQMHVFGPSRHVRRHLLAASGWFLGGVSLATLGHVHSTVAGALLIAVPAVELTLGLSRRHTTGQHPLAGETQPAERRRQSDRAPSGADAPTTPKR